MDTATSVRAVIAESLMPLATPLDNLARDPHNARRGDVAAIRNSLSVFGQRKPIVARLTGTDADGNPTGIIEAGNHTALAAEELGWSHVAAVFVTDDETTAKAYALADNRIADLAEWNDEQLAATLRELDADDFQAIDALGWSDVDLASIIGPQPPTPSERDDADDFVADDADDDEEGEADGEPAPATVYAEAEIIEAAFDHYRAAGYPYPDKPRHLAMQEVNALAALDNGKLETSNVASRVADPYQPHRYTTKVNRPGAFTPIESFARDDKLRHALTLIASEFRMRITDGNVRRVFNFVRGTQCAAQFRPAFALLMYRRFAPLGGTLLDTSTGFGGRLIGFFASELDAYIGIDPNTATCAGNKAMTDDLCPPGKTVEIHCLPAEDVPHDVVAGRADFALTSPPYFSKELYSDEPTQSCVRYTTADEWRDGFLKPMLALQLAALKPGAYNVVNIADVTIGSKTIPLAQWTIDDAQDVGFEYVRTEQFPLKRVPGQGERGDAYEPVIVLRKGE